MQAICHVSFRRYRPSKLLLSCEVVGKRRIYVVLEPLTFRERILQISDMHFQIALTSEHVADFG